MPAYLPLPAEPGAYLLVVEVRRSLRIEVGALGWLRFRKGCYLYVGSARGPGGIAARVGRHLRRDKPLRWHIDYLVARAPITAVWHACAAEALEPLWAARLEGWSPPILGIVPGFGASDSQAGSHLFHARVEPPVRALREILEVPGGGPRLQLRRSRVPAI